MHRPHILIVDDDPVLCELMTAHLVNDRYAVSSATSGASGLELSEREQPDLVLLDAVMPDCDPAALAGELRTRPSTRFVPIILLTDFLHTNGHGDPAAAVGAADYVAKPFSPDLLLARIRQVLEGHGSTNGGGRGNHDVDAG